MEKTDARANLRHHERNGRREEFQKVNDDCPLTKEKL